MQIAKQPVTTGRTPRSGPVAARPAAIGRRRSISGFRLQTILFVAIVAISAVPVLLLGSWVEHSAMQKEIESVTEKHLLIARNLSRTLGRYVSDLKEGFRAAVEIGVTRDVSPAMSRLLTSLSFSHVCIIDRDNTMIRSLIPDTETVTRLPPGREVLTPLRDLATAAGGDVVISDLIRDNGESRFFVVQALDDGRIAIGTLGVDYLRSVQRAVAFGERGHSMIVDSRGRVVAHPNAEWEAIAKDASGLSVVASMMRGETGVAQFYSPPMQADMIAGFTAVPESGWGVMVPQPMAELAERAGDTQDFAAILSLVGILIAAAISWWLAKFLARPIVAIEKAASAVASGGLHTQVEKLPAHSPRELHRLAESFDSMVTNLRHREEILRVAINQAETANRAKTEFLANMSHELRTPLNGILGFSDVLRSEMFGPLGTPRYLDYAGEIHNAGSHLLDVINDILDMAKIEANELALKESDINLGLIIESCFRMTEGRATQGKVRLRSDIPDNLPMLRADQRLTMQIVLNLLSNAIKFTPEGGAVSVRVVLEPDGYCTLYVDDSGIGIEADHLALIMKPFYQIETSMQRKFEGTGLGLPLVKAMAEIQGASVHIDSVVGQGTSVKVRFPPESVLPKEISDAAAD